MSTICTSTYHYSITTSAQTTMYINKINAKINITNLVISIPLNYPVYEMEVPVFDYIKTLLT